MNLTKTPENYQASFAEVVYAITDAPQNRPIEVAVYDSEQQNIIGIKRFNGQSSYQVNVANYLQRQFDVNPIVHPSCAIVADPSRLVGVSIKIDDSITSPKSWHTAGVVHSTTLRKLSNSTGLKKIAPDECDEISFIAPGCEVCAEFSLSGYEKNYSFALSTIIADHNIHSLIVNMNDIDTRIRQQGYVLADFSGLTVSASIDSVEFINQEYTITPRRRSSVRVCWLNRFGIIDYYTFISCANKSVSVENQRVYTQDGYKNNGSTSQFSSVLISEYEPQKTLQWLSELIASPRVWTIEDGRYNPVTIRSQSLVLHSTDLSRIEISVSPTKNTTSQKN